MESFFNPRSVAIVGASRTPGKIGYVILENFAKGEYQGKVFPVNPNADFILGLKCYPDIKSIGQKVDLVVIALPAEFVPDAVKQCSGVTKSVVIVSGGFSEIGRKDLEEAVLKNARKAGVRIVGPNCIGVLDPLSGTDTLFLSRDRLGRPPAGKIAFISQSGAVGSTVLDYLAEEGIGVSKFISYGNAIDINESDIIEYLDNDPDTKVIAIYMEGVKNGKKFLEVAKRCSKPILILKSGKTKKGGHAAASHTGSLAGEAAVYTGIFHQCGIIEAENWEELFDMAKGFAFQPLPKGANLAIVTDGGGFGVLATDEADRQGLNLPEPSQKMKNMFKGFPAYVVVHDPIDLTGDANAERYATALNVVLGGRDYNGCVVIALFQVPTLNENVVEIMAAQQRHHKPILACAAGGAYTMRLAKKLEERGIPVYSTPERAVKVYAKMLEYSRRN